MATTRGTDDEQQIRNVIDEYWKEWVLVANPPDLQRSSYFDLLSGNARDAEIEELQKKIALNESRRLPEGSVFTHTIMNLEITGISAVVLECLVDDAVVFDTTDGTIRNKAVGTSKFETHLIKGSDRWTISESFTVGSWDGVRPCDA